MREEIRKRILSILGILTFLIVMTTNVYLPNSTNMSSALAFASGVQNFYMEDLTTGVLLKNADPTKDEEGLKLDPYKFQVVNKTNKNITYNIVFKNKVEDENEKLANKYLRYSISTEEDINEVSTLGEDSIILTTVIPPHATQVFSLRLWLDYNCDNDAFGKRFSGVIQIEEVK